MKKLWFLVSFIFQNGQNFDFWWKILNAGYWFWIFSLFWDQPLLIKGILVIIPVVTLIFSIKRAIPKLQTEILKNDVQISLISKEGNKNIDRVKRITDNIPTKKEMGKVYEYAQSYAKSWASDGTFVSATFYIKLIGDKVKKNAQIFLQSNLRSETLTIYFPGSDFYIYENDGSASSLAKGKVEPIYSYPCWREGIAKASESLSSDIGKSNEVDLQISPEAESLRLNFYFEERNRRWVKKFKLKNKQLIDSEDRLVCSLK